MAETITSATQSEALQKPAAPARNDSAIGIKEADQDAPATTRSSTQMLLDEAILSRHSTRLYLPKEVPRALLERALELAAHSPSNTNTQAWRLFIVTGDALARLKAGLVHAAEHAEPDVPDLPPAFRGYRSALGRQVFGDGFGIARADVEGRRAAMLKNYEFFGAPVGVIACMDRQLVGSEAFSVGMYVQTFLLALTEMGVGSCVEISVAGFQDVVRKEVGIPDELVVLCGIAIGFEDGEANVNRIRSLRDDLESNTAWVE